KRKSTAHQPKMPSTNRRDFLHCLTAAVCATVFLNDRTVAATAQPAPRRTQGKALRSAATESDIGSLFPFVQSQAVKSDFPLSFLNPKFKSCKAWKRQARGKLLELLQYSPPPCNPHPEIVERIDQGTYIREKI